jgi:F0F1-type ATP synthase membrane subunit b/b'
LKLNGAELITQAKEEQKTLRDELQNTLKELTYTKLAEGEAQLTENANKALDKTPTMKGIFVG